MVYVTWCEGSELPVVFEFSDLLVGGYRCLCLQPAQEFLFVFLGKSSLEPQTGSHLERMQPAVQPGDVSAGAFGKQRGLVREGSRRTRDA